MTGNLSGKPKAPITVVIEDSVQDVELLRQRLKTLSEQSVQPSQCFLLVPASYKTLAQQQAESCQVNVGVIEWRSRSGVVERNALIHRSTECWITFWQEGYSWHSHTLEALLPAQNSDASMVISNVELTDTQSAVTLFETWPGFKKFFKHSPWKPIPLTESAFQQLLSEPVMTSSSMLLNVETLKRVKGFDALLPLEAQFWDAALKIALQSKVLATPYPWVKTTANAPQSSLHFILACESIFERYSIQVKHLPGLGRRRLVARVHQAYSFMNLQLKKPGAAFTRLIKATANLPEAATWSAWSHWLSNLCSVNNGISSQQTPA
ncbi:hypothetical protein ACKC9G_02530 [Pokkaliibacter sp. CJK22405]|uniref:hypothetical protein n=1 Tax=Pokkaliibacter sp. CJK22405 TaxID=3384615 RepID=UPI00398507E1